MKEFDMESALRRVSDADLRALCLWIDLNVPFYGAYEPKHVAIQREGGVVPLEEMLQ